MLGLVSFYNTKEHTIIGGDIADFCKRLVEHTPQRAGRLFVVRYNKLGTFVIAEWLAKPKDIFVDVMNLGKSLANFDRKKAHELRQRIFKPLTAEGTVRQMAAADSNYHHFRQDENSEEWERQEKVARGE